MKVLILLVFGTILIRESAFSNQPVYPVYAQIDKANQAKTLTTADFKYLSSTYKMLYSSFDKATTDSVHKYNPELKVIKYINTAEYTNNRDSWDNRQAFRFIEEENHRSYLLHAWTIIERC